MIVELLNEPPQPDPSKLPNGAERRRSRRFPITSPGILTPEGATDASGQIEITVRNVSLHGVGFICAVPLLMGEIYRVDIGEGPLKLNGRARIVSCKTRRDGAFEMGAEFF
jgi:hypothetical protein